jgi:lipoyl(octanoyl) transferase
MKTEDWGLIDYGSAVSRQLALVETVNAGEQEDTLVFCTHPPVVTLGRGSSMEEIRDWHGSVFESSRGGKATYHGPNQLVIYPVLDLKREDRRSFKPRDVHAYLRALESATVAAVREMGLLGAEARTSAVGDLSLTGVWVGTQKVASIGIAVRKWITYHGVAINVTHDPSAFQGINPCGFSANVMTSLEAQLGRSISSDDFMAISQRLFSSALN